MKSYFYILECNDKSYYYGSTSNIENRLLYHLNGKVKSTKNKLPIKLVYSEEFNTFSMANKREYQIKSWKSRLKVDKLINKQGAIV